MPSHAMNEVFTNSNDSWFNQVVQNCNVIWEPYRPPWWCFSTWVNVVYTIVKHHLEAWLWPLPFKRECIVMKDGGLVSLDWADDTESKNLPADSPILGILHTLTGDSDHYMGFMRYAARLGWRSCVLNRRGHSGMPLRTPSFCIMGNVDDTVTMVAHIRRLYPSNFVGLAGISAGSGQVVSFAGREGDNANIDALASLCPAWNLEDAFLKLGASCPWLDSWLTKGLKDYFINRPDNHDIYEGMEKEVENINKASCINDFTRAAYHFAGCSTFEQFIAENNPMNFISGMRTPALVLNALDDFVSLEENIRSDIVMSDVVEQVVLVVTKRGGHVAFNEGLNLSYMWRVTLDFFETVRRENRKREEIRSLKDNTDPKKV